MAKSGLHFCVNNVFVYFVIMCTVCETAPGQHALQNVHNYYFKNTDILE